MRIAFMIMIGGAMGALLRYLISGWVYGWLGATFPWGTLAVNMIGCFIIGFAWQLFEERALSPQMRAMFFTGGLGAFTTFSTYGLESTALFRDGQMKLGLSNVLVSNVVGLLLVIAGAMAARYMLTRGMA